MTPRIVAAVALLALGATGLAALVLLDRAPSNAQPATSTADDNGPTTAPVSQPDAGVRDASTSRHDIADPVARLERLYRIDPRRSDVNGKFVGEYICSEPRPPACVAATEGIDAEGLTSFEWLAWKVAIRFDAAHIGRPVRVQWKGWTSKQLVAVELLEICRNHDEPNVRELGTYDAGLSDDEIVLAGAPAEIEVTVGEGTYRYRLERR